MDNSAEPNKYRGEHRADKQGQTEITLLSC